MLAGISRSMPYAVPVGYFENFNASVKDIIEELRQEEEQPEWGKELPYSVPEGYFETLQAQVMARACIEDSLSNAIPFTVPTGYFEKLPEQILLAAKAADGVKAKEKKVIPFRRHHLLRQIRWAAAAVLVLGIGLGSYQIFFNAQQNPVSESILSSVPNNEIQDYVQHNYRVDIDQVISNNPVNNMSVDNKDIIQYLNETGWD
jgi:hypothetical protein